MELKDIDPGLVLWIVFNVLLVVAVVYWIYRLLTRNNRHRQ
jgi:hypothetical protein